MAGVKNENGVSSFPYMKPPERSTWETIVTTIYNKSDHTILGRTAKNWGQLLFFYTVFYIVLAALWAICMQGLLATLNDGSPKWQLDSSLIGTNPGMGFRPISNRTEEGSLIWYQSKNATSIRKWVELLDDFLLPYIDRPPGSSQITCDFDKEPKPNQTCDVAMENFGDCSKNNGYGYNTSSPCVYLKLNRIYGWQPEYFNDPDNLPAEMPADLVEYIKTEYAKDPARTNQIWVSCKGEHPADEENLNPIFDFYPTRGFAHFYYPYTNQNGYLSPLVAVKVKQPKPNVLINIECRAWAKNILYVGGYRDREGSVHFEIMRDD